MPKNFCSRFQNTCPEIPSNMAHPVRCTRNICTSRKKLKHEELKLHCRVCGIIPSSGRLECILEEREMFLFKRLWRFVVKEYTWLWIETWKVKCKVRRLLRELFHTTFRAVDKMFNLFARSWKWSICYMETVKNFGFVDIFSALVKSLQTFFPCTYVPRHLRHFHVFPLWERIVCFRGLFCYKELTLFDRIWSESLQDWRNFVQYSIRNCK